MKDQHPVRDPGAQMVLEEEMFHPPNVEDNVYTT